MVSHLSYGIVLGVFSSSILLASFTYALVLRYTTQLRSIPGPFWASFTDLWRLLAVNKGDFEVTLQALHNRYGDLVRVGPNCISVGDAREVRQIYGINRLYQKSNYYKVAQSLVNGKRLWSAVRDIVLGEASPPIPTGDLAYRGTFSRAELESFNDPVINELINGGCTYNWMGPDRHSVFYPVRNSTSFNLVLIRPDNLPPNARTQEGDIEEMRMTYEGWDPVLKKIISCHQNVTKWKLCHHEELPSWVKGNVVIIGDASHPTLPYQAQGAAMAVEDGLVLGTLLGNLANTNAVQATEKRNHIHDILERFEKLRKSRTTLNVKGAIANRKFFHMHDGPAQRQRDKDLAEVNWVDPCRWHWADLRYQQKMLGFDMVKDTNDAFARWVHELASPTEAR